VLDEELMILTKLLRIKAIPVKKHEFIEAVEKKYPGIKFSLYKGLENFADKRG
jgi:hypothetical protein